MKIITSVCIKKIFIAYYLTLWQAESDGPRPFTCGMSLIVLRDVIYKHNNMVTIKEPDSLL